MDREKEDIIALNYKPLWIQLAKKWLKKTDVIAMAGLTTNVMAQMGKDKPCLLYTSDAADDSPPV